MRIVVVGSRGQLGAALVKECRSRGHDVVELDHAALDITNPSEVLEVIGRARPEALLNTAAYNAVDAAEDHAIEALQVNAVAVGHLARAANAVGAAFVHYGSDFVFDGAANRPYTEEDPPNPRSVYAWSKLLGEWFAGDAARWYVLRVESLFGTASGGVGKGSVATIVKALQAGAVARVFEDRTLSPTHVGDGASATCMLLERGAPVGVYHCVNSGVCTWLEFAQEAAAIMGVEPTFERVRFADVKLPAQRPLYCALSNAKLARAGCTMPGWQNALKRYIREM